MAKWLQLIQVCHVICEVCLFRSQTSPVRVTACGMFAWWESALTQSSGDIRSKRNLSICAAPITGETINNVFMEHFHVCACVFVNVSS
jgi:hypothetical protein